MPVLMNSAVFIFWFQDFALLEKDKDVIQVDSYNGIFRNLRKSRETRTRKLRELNKLTQLLKLDIYTSFPKLK
jgi:hypothetical protein